MAKVIWSEEAFNDLDNIYDFIALNSLKGASLTIGRILSRTKQLETFPRSGSIVEALHSENEYRYLVEGNYKIIYRPAQEVVFVETVFDTRQSPLELDF